MPNDIWFVLLNHFERRGIDLLMRGRLNELLSALNKGLLRGIRFWGWSIEFFVIALLRRSPTHQVLQAPLLLMEIQRSIDDGLRLLLRAIARLKQRL